MTTMRQNRTARILRRLGPDVARRRAMKSRALAAVEARPVTVTVTVTETETVIVIAIVETATTTEITPVMEGDDTSIWRGIGGVAGRHARPELRDTAVNSAGLRH